MRHIIFCRIIHFFAGINQIRAHKIHFFYYFILSFLISVYYSFQMKSIIRQILTTKMRLEIHPNVSKQYLDFTSVERVTALNNFPNHILKSAAEHKMLTVLEPANSNQSSKIVKLSIVGGMECFMIVCALMHKNISAKITCCILKPTDEDIQNGALDHTIENIVDAELVSNLANQPWAAPGAIALRNAHLLSENSSTELFGRRKATAGALARFTGRDKHLFIDHSIGSEMPSVLQMLRNKE